MTSILMKHQAPPEPEQAVHKLPGRLQRLLGDWFASRNSLQRHWQNFHNSAAGHGVPYRVWSRHAAYLEMHRGMQKH